MTVESEVRETLQWAAREFTKSPIPEDQFMQLNRSFGEKLKDLLDKPRTPDIEQRIRNMVAIYRKAVEILVQK